MAWLVVTIGYAFVGVPMMHRRYLRGELIHWLWHALLAPVVAVGFFLVTMHILLGDLLHAYGRLGGGVALVAIGAMALLLAVATAPDLRRWAAAVISRTGK